MSATPPVAEWITTTPPLRGAPTSRFALATDIQRAQAHDRRSPLHPPVLRNGGGGGCGSRQEFNQHTAGAIRYASRFQPALAFDRAPASRRRTRPHNSNVRGAASAPGPLNPGLSRWLLPLVPRRTPHRFATTNASRETNASRTTNAPRPLRSGAFTMQ